jgi:hypothetical protein
MIFTSILTFNAFPTIRTRICIFSYKTNALELVPQDLKIKMDAKASSRSADKWTGAVSRAGDSGGVNISVAPCGSASEVAALQKQALIDGINDCRQNEERRMKTLLQADTPERVKELTKRHNRERASEKAQIRRLTEELRLVEKMAEADIIDIASRPRVMVRVPEMDADRFAGPIFLDAVEKFDRLDKNFKNKSRKAFNEYEERKKVSL